MIYNAQPSLSLLALGLAAGTAQGRSVPQARDSTPAGLFSRPGVVIHEASAAHVAPLVQNPYRNEFSSPTVRRRQVKSGNQTIGTLYSGVYPVVNVTWGNKAGSAQPGQHFLSFIDTGSSDTWAVASDMTCSAVGTGAPLPQEACGMGTLYDTAQGQFENITDMGFNVRYFPENVTLKGDFGYAPITIAGLTVPKQQVALVNQAAWLGDRATSGLLGLGYPMDTSAKNRKTGEYTTYDPVFTSMVKQGIVDQAVFTLALDRVPRGTPPSAPAGVLALGGLVPTAYYDGQFTSVPIEPATTGGSPYNANASSIRTVSAFHITTNDGAKARVSGVARCGGLGFAGGIYPGIGFGYGGALLGAPLVVPPVIAPFPGILPFFAGGDPDVVGDSLGDHKPLRRDTTVDKEVETRDVVEVEPRAPGTGNGKELSWYATTHGLVYGAGNASASTRINAGKFQSIVDTGTAPCFLPSQHAKAINAMFDPPATYNATLKYYTVPCDAKPPYVAYVIGGVEMPIDSRDAIFRSLNGLPGYEDTCFSSFADGGDIGNKDSDFVIGETWQMGYVVSYDQGRSMMHFAKRTGFKTMS